MDRVTRYILAAAAVCIVVASVSYVAIGWYQILSFGNRIAQISQNQQQIAETINKLHNMEKSK